MSCGDTATWELDNAGTLTISGSGDMANYTHSNMAACYAEYVEPYLNTDTGMISNVVFGDSITSIGDYAFYECRHINLTTIANTVKKIGTYCFYNCRMVSAIEDLTNV